MVKMFFSSLYSERIFFHDWRITLSGRGHIEGPERTCIVSPLIFFYRLFFSKFRSVNTERKRNEWMWICVKEGKKLDVELRRRRRRRRCTVWWSVKLELAIWWISVGLVGFFSRRARKRDDKKQSHCLWNYLVVFLAQPNGVISLHVCASLSVKTCSDDDMWIAWKLERWEIDMCAPFFFQMYDPKKESDFLQFELRFSSFFFFHSFYHLNICFSHFK